MPGTREEGNLTRRGRVCLGIGAISLVTSLVLGTLSAESAQKDLNKRIDSLFQELSHLVMLVSPTTTQHSSRPVTPAGLSILEPVDGASVHARHLVQGVVRDRGTLVWLIVHPVETGAFWVQPAVTVGWSGRWSLQAYFGRGGGIDAGKRFEVMAIADPAQTLREGEVLGTWPEAAWRSEVVSVIRAAS